MSLTLTLVFGLAVWRATRFLLDDTLIEGWRNQFYRWLWDNAQVTENEATGDPRPAPLWRHKLLQLTTCPHCLSGHLAWITVLVFAVVSDVELPLLHWAIYWWAVMGVSSVLSIVTDSLEEA